MKRILIFSLAYYPRLVGGAEVAIKEITDRVSDSEVAFDMVTLRFDEAAPSVEKIGNVTVYRVGFASFPIALNKYLFTFMGAWRASRLHRTNPYDGIWAMMANYAGFAALFFKMTYPQVPYLLTLQEGDPIAYIKKRVGVLLPLFRKIFTRADMVQAISHYLADFAREMGFNGPLEVVPNGVDVELFSRRYSDMELATLKDTLGKKYSDTFLITTSRLVAKNAVGDIIQALRYLPESVKLLILGVGPLEAELKALALKFGLIERVHFLGFISHQEMPKYLAISDIFVRPALSEGFGLSYVEAMAAGLPVVTTAVGGIVDFLTPPEASGAKAGSSKKALATGLFCEVANPKSVAEQVERLLSDPTLRKEIVTNAKSMVVEKYDWSLIAGEMKKLFLKLTNERHA